MAEEAAVTAAALGSRVERLYDVGVAGLHRLLHQRELLLGANVLVVVAGMEGALPSAVGALTSGALCCGATASASISDRPARPAASDAAGKRQAHSMIDTR